MKYRKGGFIFADTIADNSTVGDEFPDPDKLQDAIETANLSDFVNELPFGLYTKIGEGAWNKPGTKATVSDCARSI